MRLIEVEENWSPEMLHDFIEEECQPYLREIDNEPLGKVLYRGIQRREEHDYLIVNPRQNRRPLGTDEAIHKKFVKAFRELGFEANRDNSLFCTGNQYEARQYGLVYAVFPIGKFSYTWSEDVEDLIIVSREMPKNVKQFVRDNYQDHDLVSAIESKNEVMLKCERVLLVNLKIMPEIFQG